MERKFIPSRPSCAHQEDLAGSDMPSGTPQSRLTFVDWVFHPWPGSSWILDSEQLCLQSELKPWAGMADRGRSAVNDSIQVCQIWRFDNMCPNDRLDRPLSSKTISHAGHAMLQAAIGR